MQVTRRGFMGVGGLIASAWLLPEQVKSTAVDLTKFVREEPIRKYDLSLPFRQEGLSYATDGAICVRTDRIVIAETTETIKLPPASALPWGQGKWRTWNPKRKRSDILQGCPLCNWKRRIGPGIRECATCFGDGALFDHDFGKRCMDCRGFGFTGGVECPECSGRGGVEYVIRLGNATISPHYDSLIRRELGDVEYWQGDNPRGVINFRSSGAEGLLMPLEK